MKPMSAIGWFALAGLAAGAGGLPARAAVPPQADTAAQESPEAFLDAGDRAFRDADFASALAAYSRISPVRIPVGAQNRLAIAYHALGMLREAEAIYRVATARDREYAPALNNMGALYYARGDFGRAEDRFRDSLRYAPGNGIVERNLHAAKYARENSRSSRARLAAISEENSLVWEGSPAEVLEVAALIDPELGAELAQLVLRGDVFTARKMFEDAIIEYERYLEIDPYDAHVANKLGITYQQAQRAGFAEEQYRRALRLNPYFVPALNNLGSIEQGRGDFLMALDYYRRALEIGGESATVLQNLGACLFAMERYEEGLVAYIRAVQLDPDLFDRLGGRGGTLVQTTFGNESMTNYYLARLFASHGDLDRTMSFLYRAVEEGFDNAEMLDDPAFGDLRTDDRFLRLVASLGEPS
jgi:tetratricopeptide (TPR) repeat protein